MNKQRQLYECAEGAVDYAALVQAEDCDGNLAAFVRSLVGPEGAHVVDVGAGTGRIAGLLLDAGATVTAAELAAPMLAALRARFGASVTAIRADARDLPLPDAGFDHAIAGWVFGHFRGWYPDSWRTEVGLALDEQVRVVRRGGVAAIIESLGTGTPTPTTPSASRAEFLAFLQERGWRRTAVLRTDYRFADHATATDLLTAFFGARAAEMLDRFGYERVPECTGIWLRTV